jgi:hypothetical protein
MARAKPKHRHPLMRSYFTVYQGHGVEFLMHEPTETFFVETNEGLLYKGKDERKAWAAVNREVEMRKKRKRSSTRGSCYGCGDRSGTSGLGAFLSPSSANRRRYRKVYSSNVVSKVVPRACALVQSGPKKGKLRKGCHIKAGRAYCDATIIDRLPAEARRPGKTKSGRPRAKVVCK